MHSLGFDFTLYFFYDPEYLIFFSRSSGSGPPSKNLVQLLIAVRSPHMVIVWVFFIRKKMMYVSNVVRNLQNMRT
jgi:hypothetical protein